MPAFGFLFFETPAELEPSGAAELAPARADGEAEPTGALAPEAWGLAGVSDGAPLGAADDGTSEIGPTVELGVEVAPAPKTRDALCENTKNAAPPPKASMSALAAKRTFTPELERGVAGKAERLERRPARLE